MISPRGVWRRLLGRRSAAGRGSGSPVAAAQPGLEYPRWPVVAKTVLFWFLFLWFIIFTVLGCAVGLVPGFIILGVGLVVFRRWWVGRQHALLYLMLACAERSLSMAAVLRAFAAERSGLFARSSRRLGEMVAAGVPLPTALDLSPWLLPAEARSRIRVGHDVGALATALRDAIAVRERHDTFWSAAMGKLFYIALVLLVMLQVLAFIMLEIVPEFSQIFGEFGIQLPRLTQWLIGISYGISTYWYVILFPLALGIGLPLLYGVLRSMELTGPGLPGLQWLERRLTTATVLENLAVAVERDRPMPEAIERLTAAYPSVVIRRKLMRALERVNSGADWVESLAAVKLLGKPEVAVLQAAQRVGNVAWALREMADSNRRRHAYRMQLWLQILFPLSILALGALVGFAVVSLFVPLIPLIMSVVK